MRINAQQNAEPVAGVTPRPAAPRAGGERADSVTFVQTEALEGQLRETAEVRPQKVGKARQLLGDVRYPPLETIQRIAALLAVPLDQSENQ